MDGFTVLKQDNAQGTIVRLQNPFPFSDATVMLDVYGIRVLDGLFNPTIFNTPAIGSLSSRLEVLCCLHVRTVS